MPSPDLTHSRERINGRATAWAHRSGHGRTLVLVPGLSMSWRAYAWLVEQIEASRPLVIVDPPGCGRSQSLAGTLTAGAQATHLSAVLEHLGLTEADLVGHSFGALTAARLAAHRPDLVTSTTLISPSPDTDFPHFRHHLLALLRGLPAEAPRVLIQAVTDYVRSNPRVLAGFSAELTTNPHDIMDGVPSPVLIIRGTEDDLSGAEFCQALAGASGGSVVTLPDGAHGLPQQRPKDLAEILHRFHARAAGGP